MIGDRQQDFLRYLRFEKRFSTHTLTAYQNDLEQFRVFVTVQFDISEVVSISHFHIRSWLSTLKDEKKTARTINRKLSSLNSFYKYLLREGKVQTNPAGLIHALRTPERLPVFLKEKETDHIFGELAFGEGFPGFTERLICELLYQCGLRRNELVELKENNIEWSLKQIKVLGKGNKERLIPVNETLLEQINDYLRDKKNIENADNDHLLVLENGQPLYPQFVYRTVKKYLTMTTTLTKKSPHILRHTFATHLLNNGANIQAIKDLLGHSSLAATQVYTHNNIDKLKEIHKLNHPRG